MDATRWPNVAHGLAKVSKKNEDFAVHHTCEWTDLDSAFGPLDSVPFEFFAVFDGHGGQQAANDGSTSFLARLQRKLDAIRLNAPTTSLQELWRDHLTGALRETFLELDTDFKTRLRQSGTTATVVIVTREHGAPKNGSGRVMITVANVGDSHAYFESCHAGIISLISENHRAGENSNETRRIADSNGVSRLERKAEKGEPMRLYPGGLMVTRTLGDVDALHASAEPAIQQYAVYVPRGGGGGRIIIASDGLWDAIRPGDCFRLVRSIRNARQAASTLTKETAKREGRESDDVTVFVVDLADPPETWGLAKSRQHPLVRGVPELIPTISTSSASIRFNAAMRRARETGVPDWEGIPLPASCTSAAKSTEKLRIVHVEHGLGMMETGSWVPLVDVVRPDSKPLEAAATPVSPPQQLANGIHRGSTRSVPSQTSPPKAVLGTSLPDATPSPSTYAARVQPVQHNVLREIEETNLGLDDVSALRLAIQVSLEESKQEARHHNQAEREVPNGRDSGAPQNGRGRGSRGDGGSRDHRGERRPVDSISSPSARVSSNVASPRVSSNSASPRVPSNNARSTPRTPIATPSSGPDARLGQRSGNSSIDRSAPSVPTIPPPSSAPRNANPSQPSSSSTGRVSHPQPTPQSQPAPPPNTGGSSRRAANAPQSSPKPSPAPRGSPSQTRPPASISPRAITPPPHGSGQQWHFWAGGFPSSWTREEFVLCLTETFPQFPLQNFSLFRRATTAWAYFTVNKTVVEKAFHTLPGDYQWGAVTITVKRYEKYGEQTAQALPHVSSSQ